MFRVGYFSDKSSVLFGKRRPELLRKIKDPHFGSIWRYLEVFVDEVTFQECLKSWKSTFGMFPVTRFRESWRKLILELRLPIWAIQNSKNINFRPVLCNRGVGWSGVGWGGPKPSLPLDFTVRFFPGRSVLEFTHSVTAPSECASSLPLDSMENALPLWVWSPKWIGGGIKKIKNLKKA